MKLKNIATSFLIFSLLFLSCEKNNDAVTPTYSIQGLYIGTYTVNQQPTQPPLAYSFIIYPDGTLSTKGKGANGKDAYSTGTWTLNANSVFTGTITQYLTTTATPITQSVTGTFSTSGEITNGTWTDVTNPYGPLLSGKFSTMLRVN